MYFILKEIQLKKKFFCLIFALKIKQRHTVVDELRFIKFSQNSKIYSTF